MRNEDLTEAGLAAIESGNSKKLKKLFEKGLDSDNRDIRRAVRRTGNEGIKKIYDIYRWLNRIGPEFRQAGSSVAFGDISKFKNLIRNVSISGKEFSQFLRMALYFNNLPAVEYLKDNYPDILEKTLEDFRKTDFHPVIPAANGKDPEFLKRIIKLFPDYGPFIGKAGISAVNNNAESVLEFLLGLSGCTENDRIDICFEAAHKGNIRMTGMALDSGVPADIVRDGLPVLHHIINLHFELREGEPEKIIRMIEFLIDRGADPAVIYKGRTPAEAAFAKDCPETAYYLLGRQNLSEKEHLAELKKLKVPDELLDYLSDGKNTETRELPSDCEFPWLRLCSAAELHKTEIFIDPNEYDSNYGDRPKDPNTGANGIYTITAVDIVRDCADYPQRGMLVWIPDLEMYGTADTAHGVVYLFKDTGWREIAARIDYYAGYQWKPLKDDNVLEIYEACRPWELWEFEKR